EAAAEPQAAKLRDLDFDEDRYALRHALERTFGQLGLDAHAAENAQIEQRLLGGGELRLRVTLTRLEVERAPHGAFRDLVEAFDANVAEPRDASGLDPVADACDIFRNVDFGGARDASVRVAVVAELVADLVRRGLESFFRERRTERQERRRALPRALRELGR